MSDNDWTYVAPKGRKKAICQAQPVQQSRQIDNDATANTLRVEYEERRKSWLQSGARDEVFTLLKLLGVNEEGPSFKRAVCLALGTLNQTNLSNRNRSLLQLAAFLDIVNHLQASLNEQLEVSAQDPAFTSLDKEFLASLGITAVEYDRSEEDAMGPAFDRFAADTFVAEFYIEHSPKLAKRILDSEIGLLVGTLVDVIQGPSYVTIIPKSYLQERFRWYKFPTFELDPMAFNALSILRPHQKEVEVGQDESD